MPGDVKATAFIDHFYREMECAADIIVEANPTMRETIEPNERAKAKAKQQETRGLRRGPNWNKHPVRRTSP